MTTLQNVINDINSKKILASVYYTTSSETPQLISVNDTYFVSVSSKPNALYLVNGTDVSQTLNLDFTLVNDGSGYNVVSYMATKRTDIFYSLNKVETISQTKNIVMEPKSFIFISSTIGYNSKTSNSNITIKVLNINNNLSTNDLDHSKTNNSNNSKTNNSNNSKKGKPNLFYIILAGILFILFAIFVIEMINKNKYKNET